MSAKKLSLFILSFVICTLATAQSLPIGFSNAEEFLRRSQLVNQFDSSISFSVRPLTFMNHLKRVPKAGFENSRLFEAIPLTQEDSLYILPVSLLSKFTSHHPTGWNDGSFMPNKGLQTRISAGIFLRHNRWQLQLNPEINYSENKPFDQFTDDHFDVIWQRMYRWWNTIDEPIRFGAKSSVRFYPGQSFLKYNLGKFSTGISSESLWWGPGKRNSLIMSNNAPGFYHLTFHTNGPVKTEVGSFEGQFISGILTNSGFLPPEPERTFLQTQLYYAPKDESRYLSGLTLAWQPKWVPGLFLGYSRTSQVYFREIKSFRDVQPFLNGKRERGVEPRPNLTNNQQQSSGYLRWLLSESNTEFYIEYGTNGRRRGFREFLVQANRHRAFTMGVSKVYPIKRKQFIQFDAEITQLGQVVREVVRDADSWYTDKHIRQGYTNQGQVIGAGIGPGSNVFYFETSWWTGMKKIGIFAERLVHNNDFLYYAYEDSKDWRRFWTDLSTGVVADWKFDRLVLSSTIRWTKSWNYQWYLLQEPGDPYFVKGRDVDNIYATINAAYFFR
ncbi:MAG: capsule assembly Wzi family protein [Imperialibacter sp.]|uniref:capsule assembly Wzi family protein n=1 Tax=Imperialibacter sp. TaxID=2038411 RepID=UPI0032EFE833